MRYSPKNSMEFSKEKWNDSPDQRGYMINDLKSKYDLDTMNKEEVIELLGRRGIQDYGDRLEYHFNYIAQIPGVFGYFEIRFDEKASVKSYRVYIVQS